MVGDDESVELVAVFVDSLRDETVVAGLGEGDWLDFSIPDDSVWVKPAVKDCVTMLSLATEEIRDLAKSKLK